MTNGDSVSYFCPGNNDQILPGLEPATPFRNEEGEHFTIVLSSRRFIKILVNVFYVKMTRIYHKYIGINRDHVWIAKVCQNGFEVMKFVAWNRITASNYWDVACCYQDQRISSSLDLKPLRFSFYHPYHLIQHIELHLSISKFTIDRLNK